VSEEPAPAHALLADPPRAPGRPLPWRPLAAVLVPCAALALGVGLQRAFEGPLPTGDALWRWLWVSSGVGLLLGLAAGLVLAVRRLSRLLWACWGLASPWALAGLTLLAVRGARPLREQLAQAKVARCRAEGRSSCTSAEFRAACSGATLGPSARARGMARLGAPAQELCGDSGCTFRWVFEGPWLLDDYVEPGALWCSVVAAPDGRGLRATVLPGTEPKR